MDKKDKEYRDKVGNENASFVESIPGIFDAMKDMLPDGEEKELFGKAVEEVKAGIFETADELRNNDEVKEKLAERKPPALWELEKHMYNKSAEELGVEGIEEYEQEESRKAPESEAG